VVIVVYTPILLFLPVLLLVGVVFVVVPGGFIIVLCGLYYTMVGFTGLLGLSVSGRRRAGASRVPANTSSENRSRPGRSSFDPRLATAARPATSRLAADPMLRSAPNFELSQRGPDGINLGAARERGHDPDRQDGGQAA